MTTAGSRGRLLGLSSLDEESLFLEHGRVTVHQVRKRTKVVLIQKSNSNLRL